MTPRATAYISIGSNIDPRRHLEAAVRLLALRARLAGVSTVYRTPPEGTATSQDDYLNCVAIIRTGLPREAIGPTLLAPIEGQLGRIRSEDRFAPRTIDLDLVAWERPGRPAWLHDRKMQDDHVRVPLAELAPHLVSPAPALPAGYQAMADLTAKLKRLARSSAM